MKIQLLGIIACLFLWSCTSDEISNNQSEHFVKLFGTSALQESGEVEQTSDDGYVFVGTTIGSNGDKDVLLVKVDRFGNEMWQKSFGDTLDQIGSSIEINADGGYIIAGTHINRSGEEDVFMVRTDGSGNTIWSDTIGDNQFNQSAVDVKVNTSGNFVITGYTTAPRAPQDSLNPDDVKASNPAGTKDIYFAEISSTGTLIRNAAYGVNTDDYGTGIQVKNNGNGYILVGTSPGSKVTLGGDNILILNTNGVGDVIAVESYGGPNNDVAGSIHKNPGGNYSIVGTVLGDDGIKDVNLIVLPGESANDIFNPITNTIIETSESIEALSIVRLNSGSYGVVGSKLVTSTNTKDAIYLKLTFDGQLENEVNLGGSGQENATSIKATSDGGAILLTTSGYEGNDMIGLIRTDADGNLN